VFAFAAAPPARKTIDTLLDEARARSQRLAPNQAHAAIGERALIVDIRSEVQRAADGVVPGALFVPRNVLEWRCDPSCDSYDRRVGGLDTHLLLMCDEGYQSSLAAASLKQIGFARATDMIGGFQAWRAAGLPVQRSVDGDATRAIECPCGHEPITVAGPGLAPGVGWAGPMAIGGDGAMRPR
jgi:rhodanese-related sulfurtransferase